MEYKVITYKDDYGTEYKTRPIPVSSIKRKIHSIRETNDNRVTIISIQ